MDFPAAVQGYLVTKKIPLCHTKQRYGTLPPSRKCNMDQYGETKNKHTRLPLGNHMMRSLGGHVHTVNRKIKKFTSKKKVLRIKTGLKWLRRKPNV
jgi:hypothetical protein